MVSVIILMFNKVATVNRLMARVTSFRCTDYEILGVDDFL